jgi:mannose-6-phosphate isomerase-like protein (cupin superfamily)
MSNNKLFEYYDGQILCHHSRDENSQSVHFYLHAHEHMELFYFISGNVEYVVEGNIYKLSPGDIVLARSAEVHRPVIYPGTPYERISIQFSDAVIKSRKLQVQVGHLHGRN